MITHFPDDTERSKAGAKLRIKKKAWKKFQTFCLPSGIFSEERERGDSAAL